LDVVDVGVDEVVVVVVVGFGVLLTVDFGVIRVGVDVVVSVVGSVYVEVGVELVVVCSLLTFDGDWPVLPLFPLAAISQPPSARTSAAITPARMYGRLEGFGGGGGGTIGRTPVRDRGDCGEMALVRSVPGPTGPPANTVRASATSGRSPRATAASLSRA
jgi:hypothetical protein